MPQWPHPPLWFVTLDYLRKSSFLERPRGDEIVDVAFEMSTLLGEMRSGGRFLSAQLDLRKKAEDPDDRVAQVFVQHCW